MFWDVFYELCNKNNTKPTPVVKELGIAHGVVTKWKNGATPNSESDFVANKKTPLSLI